MFMFTLVVQMTVVQSSTRSRRWFGEPGRRVHPFRSCLSERNSSNRQNQGWTQYASQVLKSAAVAAGAATAPAIVRSRCCRPAPVAMLAFYLKGVSPAHVTINQIVAGMMLYMLIVILCLAIMGVRPGMTS